jgi:hypothetical protein
MRARERLRRRAVAARLRRCMKRSCAYHRWALVTSGGHDRSRAHLRADPCSNHRRAWSPSPRTARAGACRVPARPASFPTAVGRALVPISNESEPCGRAATDDSQSPPRRRPLLGQDRKPSSCLGAGRSAHAIRARSPRRPGGLGSAGETDGRMGRPLPSPWCLRQDRVESLCVAQAFDTSSAPFLWGSSPAWRSPQCQGFQAPPASPLAALARWSRPERGPTS